MQVTHHRGMFGMQRLKEACHPNDPALPQLSKWLHGLVHHACNLQYLHLSLTFLPKEGSPPPMLTGLPLRHLSIDINIDSHHDIDQSLNSGGSVQQYACTGCSQV